MVSRRLTALAALVAISLVAGCGSVGSGGSTGGYVSGDRTITVVPVADRQPAPELSGVDLNGTRLSSDDLLRTHRVLVVNVWGSWCGPCRREAPVLSAVSKQYAKRGVAFLGLLSRDKPAAASAFVRRFDLNYPSLQDRGGRLQLRFAETLPSQGIPTTWVIDRHGRVAARVLVEVTKPTLVGLIDDELARK